jgi:hypothetical protein
MKTLALLCVSLAALSAQETSWVQTNRPDALITPTTVTALSDTINFAPTANRNISIDPGIRLSPVQNGVALFTFDGKNIDLNAGAESFPLASGSIIGFVDNAWNVGNGRVLRSFQIHARRQAQDDTDENLKSMKDAAQKLKTKDPQPARKLRIRWLYAEDPFPTAELFNTPAIQQLSHLSPVGF